MCSGTILAKMNNANVHDLLEDFSYRESISNFNFNERLELMELVAQILSKGELNILQPFVFRFKDEQADLVQFIHHYVLREGGKLDNKVVIDPVIHNDVLSAFIKEIASFKAGLIAINFATEDLDICGEVHKVNINNKAIRFLALLLANSPNAVSYSLMVEKLDLQSSEPQSIRLIRSDLFKYLKSIFSNESVSYLKRKLHTARGMGYYFVD